MRSAKGRKEVIKRIFVSDVDGRQPQAHLVFITFKYVVVTDGHIEKLRDAIRGGFLSSFSVFGAGNCNNVDPNCDTGHGFGRPCVGVARCDPQNSPASNCWSGLRGAPNESVKAIAGCPVEVVVVCAQFPPKQGAWPATSPLS